MPGATIHFHLSEPSPDLAASESAFPRLRIATIYRRFNRSGSIESLFLRNAERLAQDEDVTVFASASKRAAPSAPIRFVPVESTTWGGERLGYALECSSFARRASKAVARQRAGFDVIHVEGFASFDADLVTVHAVRAAEIEHYFTRVEPEAGVIRRRLNAHLFRPQSAVVMRIERRLFERRSPPYCICPTRAVKGDLERWHGVPADRIGVVPYGLELDCFRRDPGAGAQLRAELGTPPGRLVLLFVGSPFERKGLAVAMEGFVRSRVAEAELWVIGGTDAERARLARTRLDDRIRILGRKDAA
ncbi:MAG: glycosyltransferase family 4 protein, partial [Gaiellaceae bacterium]